MKPLATDPLDIVIAGVGGQGGVLAARVLGQALLTAGYGVTVGETLGLSQRGGTVRNVIRITQGEPPGPLVPRNRASVVMGLEPLETLRLLLDYGHPQVVTITNDRPLPPINVIAGGADYPDTESLRAALSQLCARLHWLPATSVALELGSPILANVVMLGALSASGLLPLGRQELEASLAQLVPPAKMEANQRALMRGSQLME